MPTDAPPPAKPSIWRAFTQPAAWTMAFLGFSSGLPFLLVAGTLSYWLKDNGIELKSITMIASAGMSYALKFLWAPLLDHWELPLFRRLGLRRGWLLFSQLWVTGGLLTMAALSPSRLPAFIGATLVVAFFGATQDIAVDAYRIEIAPVEAQGALVATYALGYRIALIVSGALALIMADHMPWPTVYLVMAATMVVPIVTTFLAREPEVVRDIADHWEDAMRESVIEPFTDFFGRYGWALALATLAFILLFKIPEQATIGGVMGPFYRDMGFDKTQIAAVTKIWGVWVGILGVFVGGAMVARWGMWRTLGLAIVVAGVSNLLYLFLLRHPGDIVVLTLVISGENFTLGVLGPPTIAFLSSLVNTKHTATQYSLLSSLVNLPGKGLGFFAGAIVMSLGYAAFFVITVVSLLPAMILFAWLWRRHADPPGGAPAD